MDSGRLADWLDDKRIERTRLRLTGGFAGAHVERVGDGGLGAVRDPELPVDRGEMELDRVHRQAEPACDLGVRQTAGRQLEYFDLSVRDPGERATRPFERVL